VRSAAVIAHSPRGLTSRGGGASAAPDLAKGISDILGLPLGKANISRFNDGECNIQLGENVRNTHVFLVQSTSPPVNDSLMELFLLVSLAGG
jgi:ribose-phosphate pyrophosphokinase